MRLCQIAQTVRPWAFAFIVLASGPAMPGCGGGEAQTTGSVVHDDPDAALRTKEMEDYMAKQNAPKKKR